jgi:hypothetical protein
VIGLPSLSFSSNVKSRKHKTNVGKIWSKLLSGHELDLFLKWMCFDNSVINLYDCQGVK